MPDVDDEQDFQHDRGQDSQQDRVEIDEDNSAAFADINNVLDRIDIHGEEITALPIEPPPKSKVCKRPGSG